MENKNRDVEKEVLALGYKFSQAVARSGNYYTSPSEELTNYVSVQVECACGEKEEMYGTPKTMQNPIITFIKWEGISEELLKKHGHAGDEIKKMKKDIISIAI